MWLGIVLLLMGSTFCQWMLKEQSQPAAFKRPIFYNPVFVIVGDFFGIGMTLAGLALIVRSCAV